MKSKPGGPPPPPFSLSSSSPPPHSAGGGRPIIDVGRKEGKRRLLAEPLFSASRDRNLVFPSVVHSRLWALGSGSSPFNDTGSQPLVELYRPLTIRHPVPRGSLRPRSVAAEVVSPLEEPSIPIHARRWVDRRGDCRRW